MKNLLIVVLLSSSAACMPAAKSPQGAAYEAQQAACLDLPTHAERRACIDKVRADWSK